MQKNFTYLLVKILVLTGVFIAGLSVGVMCQPAPNYDLAGPLLIKRTAKPVSVMVDEGNGVIKVAKDIAWAKDMTVYQALQSAGEKGNFKLSVKDYGGELGVFVEAIDGQKGKSDAWWQYWVNNAYGEIGASNAKINPGDAIEWKLVKGQIKQ